MKKIIIGIIAVVVLGVIYAFSAYNGFVSANEAVDGQWAQVEAQYQRRLDLIPNLVESVKGIMQQEEAIFTAIADARSRYTGATSVDEKARAATAVEGALGRLLAVFENYPQLRSSETVQNLMVQLEGTENRVSTERGRYNEKVQSFNVKVKRFPGSVFASIFGFGDRAYFESDEGAENAPKVDF